VCVFFSPVRLKRSFFFYSARLTLSVPFAFVRRVDVDEWMGKKGSWDNTYEGTFGEGGVGWKAQAVLGQVKGDRFRHEKNKRKRSTYRGGLIDDNKVNSIPFPDSDDE
jgi:hypothetical protein